jgi:hypothetical protein
MNGTRELGLPASTLALEMDRKRPPHSATQGDDFEALTGFEVHDVKNN